MQDTETYLCEGCYDMYRELYTLRLIDEEEDEEQVLEEQVLEDEEEPIQALSTNDECDDPCDLINEVIY